MASASELALRHTSTGPKIWEKEERRKKERR
jgi:hypothetical protein